jgi:hypothetical protein
MLIMAYNMFKTVMDSKPADTRIPLIGAHA